jgi:hypothetical protein
VHEDPGGRGDLLDDPGDERAVPRARVEQPVGRELVEGVAVLRPRSSALTPVSSTATVDASGASGTGTAGNGRAPLDGSGPPAPLMCPASGRT